jgi:hypothetical protein
MGLRQTLERIALGHRDRVDATVYGTIVVMATLAAGSKGAETQPWELATVVAVTVLVLWVAHVYANALHEGLEQGSKLTLHELRSVARHEFALPLAAVAPIAMLGAAELGLISTQAGVWLALGFGVAALAFQGLRYAALEHLGLAGTLGSVGLNVALGLAIVALEASITH